MLLAAGLSLHCIQLTDKISAQSFKLPRYYLVGLEADAKPHKLFPPAVTHHQFNCRETRSAHSLAADQDATGEVYLYITVVGSRIGQRFRIPRLSRAGVVILQHRRITKR